MALIVHKYGGTSMGSTDRIKNVAARVAKWHDAGHQIIVVPSAMSGETNRLIGLAKEIMAQQDPVPAGLRVGVVGGGCSGFSYNMTFENQQGMMDKVFNFDGLKVFVDPTSIMYLNGCTVDYVETIEAAGFKFDNPSVKSTCGCGSSFNV